MADRGRRAFPVSSHACDEVRCSTASSPAAARGVGLHPLATKVACPDLPHLSPSPSFPPLPPCMKTCKRARTIALAAAAARGYVRTFIHCVHPHRCLLLHAHAWPCTPRHSSATDEHACVLPAHATQQKWQRHCQELHKQRLNDIKPQVDASAPATMNIQLNHGKKAMLEKERQYEVDKVCGRRGRNGRTGPGAVVAASFRYSVVGWGGGVQLPTQTCSTLLHTAPPSPPPPHIQRSLIPCTGQQTGWPIGPYTRRSGP